MATVEDEKIYDLGEVYFNFGTENIRLVSSDGASVTYKLDESNVNDLGSYYRVATILKGITIEAEIKGIVNINTVRDAVAKSVLNPNTEISVGLYNKEPGATPVIDDILYGVKPSELKIEKKEGNSCDLKVTASYSKTFKPN